MYVNKKLVLYLALFNSNDSKCHFFYEIKCCCLSITHWDYKEHYK